MHPGGFEPPTARFVAEYSIQLSYGCIGITSLLQNSSEQFRIRQEWCIREDDSSTPRPTGRCLRNVILPGADEKFRRPCNNGMAVTRENMVHPGGFEPPTARFVAEYSIQLSYGCIGKLALLRVSVTTNTCHTEYDGVIGRVTRLRLALRAAAFTAFFFLFTERRWCIREDSNLRPLGS